MKAKEFKAVFTNDWLLHSPFWVGWIVIMNAGESNGFGFYYQGSHDLLIPLILNTSFNVIFFYSISLKLAPSILKVDKALEYLLILIGLSSIFILSKTGAEKLYINYFLTDLRLIPFSELVRENLYSFPVLIGAAHLYWMFRKNRTEREWLVKDKLSRELALIKAQVSPHFLFNVLNNLYSLGLQGKQEQVTSGILKLSDLLRYVIYDCQKETISLEKELNYISDFIEINKLMFTQEMHSKVTFETKGSTKNYQIPPMLLVTFVENAFKYGVCNVGKTEIKVIAEISENTLIFRSKNRICYSARVDSLNDKYNGIGLKNIKEQLNILYEGRHSLIIKEKEEFFEVKLKIELK